MKELELFYVIKTWLQKFSYKSSGGKYHYDERRRSKPDALM